MSTYRTQKELEEEIEHACQKATRRGLVDLIHQLFADNTKMRHPDTRAASVRPYMCDHCDHLHLQLKKEDGTVYTECVLSLDMLERMMDIVIKAYKEKNNDAPTLA